MNPHPHRWRVKFWLHQNRSEGITTPPSPLFSCQCNHPACSFEGPPRLHSHYRMLCCCCFSPARLGMETLALQSKTSSTTAVGATITSHYSHYFPVAIIPSRHITLLGNKDQLLPPLPAFPSYRVPSTSCRVAVRIDLLAPLQ